MYSNHTCIEPLIILLNLIFFSIENLIEDKTNDNFDIKIDFNFFKLKLKY